MSDDAPTETTDERDQTIADLEARVAELEEENERLRETPPDPQSGEVTAQLQHYEAASFKAEVQAWERETGLSYDEADA